MIPKYGKVLWKDAASFSGKTTPKRITKELPVVVSVGRLFLAGDGTLAILHEYKEGAGFQRDVEATLIPSGWYTEIVALTEATDTPKKVEGTDAVHHTEQQG